MEKCNTISIFGDVEKTTFDRQRCEECCIKFVGTFSATENDIIRWRKEGRDDILSHVYFITEKWGDLFFDPKTGEEILTQCPFVMKVRNKNEYQCMIHDTKPDVCREYPFIGDNEGVYLRMKE